MSELESLLALQAHDTHIDQLRHKKATLPERAELADVDGRHAVLGAERQAVAASLDEIAERQATAEGEIAAAEKRIGEIDARMRSGAVSASRELQAMQGEIDSIKHRVSTLEDAALEAMDEREPVDAQVLALDEQLAALATRADDLRAAITTAEAAIDAEVEAESGVREQLAATLPKDLVTTYERLRASLGGVGAARLDGNRCSGCHLTLPATELDRLRRAAPDSLVFCDQCGRILVRTA